jgi:hypothetical protein
MALAAIKTAPYGMCDPDAPTIIDRLVPKAVEVVDGRIVFRPKSMKLSRYYLAEVNGVPYVYRRVSEGEVEVYGLARPSS